MGNVGRSPEQQKLHAFHKKCAIKYGSMIVKQLQFTKLIPRENLTSDDVERLQHRKADDLYDTLFMCLYFVSTFMFHAYKIRKAGVSKSLPAFKNAPQRPRNAWQELLEAAAAFGSDKADIEKVFSVLTNSRFVLPGPNLSFRPQTQNEN